LRGVSIAGEPKLAAGDFSVMQRLKHPPGQASQKRSLSIINIDLEGINTKGGDAILENYS
jgi:hypothetical protein